MIDQPIQDFISPLSANLVLADRTPPEQNPATIYLASLAEGSRRTMREALNTIAALLGVDETRNAAGQDVRCLITPWGSAPLRTHGGHPLGPRRKVRARHSQ